MTRYFTVLGLLFLTSSTNLMSALAAAPGAHTEEYQIDAARFKIDFASGVRGFTPSQALKIERDGEHYRLTLTADVCVRLHKLLKQDIKDSFFPEGKEALQHHTHLLCAGGLQARGAKTPKAFIRMMSHDEAVRTVLLFALAQYINKLRASITGLEPQQIKEFLGPYSMLYGPDREGDCKQAYAPKFYATENYWGYTSGAQTEPPTPTLYFKRVEGRQLQLAEITTSHYETKEVGRGRLILVNMYGYLAMNINDRTRIKFYQVSIQRTPEELIQDGVQQWQVWINYSRGGFTQGGLEQQHILKAIKNYEFKKGCYKTEAEGPLELFRAKSGEYALRSWMEVPPAEDEPK